jgi:hypothetical protein
VAVLSLSMVGEGGGWEKTLGGDRMGGCFLLSQILLVFKLAEGDIW